MLQSTQGFSLPIGLYYYLRIGIGYGYHTVDSKVFDVLVTNSGMAHQLKDEAQVPSSDYGAIVGIPVVDIYSRLNKRPVTITNDIRPLLDMTFGAVRRHVGPDVNYSDPAYSGSLPRQAVLGWGLETGFATRFNGIPWKLITLSWAREASDVLVRTQEIVTATPQPDGGTSYKYAYIPGGFESGFGSIQPFENLLLGKTNGRITLDKGWEIQVAEFLYIRNGSSTGPYGLIYSTSGGSLKLAGLVKLLSTLHLVDAREGTLAFIADHLNLEYSYSGYTSSENLSYRERRSARLRS